MKLEDMNKEELIKEITACRKMLEEARETIQQNDDYQRKYIELIEESLDGFAMLDKEGRFVFCNDEYCRLTGYSSEELKNETYKDLTPSEYHGLDSENFNKMFTRGFSELYEKEYLRKDGDRIPIEIRSYLIKDVNGEFSGTWSYVRDISARKQAEEERREIGERFRIAQEMSPDGFTILRPVRDNQSRVVDFTWVYENEAVARMNGTDPQKVVGQRLLDLFPGHRGTQFFNAYKQVAEKGMPIAFEDKYVGETIKKETWFRVVVVPMTENIAILNQDITERKKTEENLINTFNLSPSIIAKANLKTGSYIEANQAVTRILGYSIEEFISKSIKEFIHPDDTEATVKAMTEQLEGKNVFIENRFLCKNGFYKWISWNANSANDEGIVLGIGSDISERKVLQERLTQAQKMESVGRLAGGVAHDFNNMISVIIGNVEMAIEDLEKDSFICDRLEEIRKAAKRSADLTGQLLAFARKQVVSPKNLDLNKTIESTLKMLRRLIGEHISLTFKPHKEICPVKVDSSQIVQILTNLCVNSRDAITDVGKILIETDTVVLNELYCLNHPELTPGEYILLTVSDNGSGMDSETLSNIFEPFFTTKEPGKGTGLGLSSIYGAVKQNRGYVNVYSEPGYGSTFKIYLPRYQEKGETHYKQKKDIQTIKGYETILLVEDEPAILRMTHMMLERLGYQVLAANTPSEAIRLAQECKSAIHLLITDVIMPEMNGRSLAKKVLSMYPDIRRLFMSGYSEDVIAHHGVLDENVNFIEKPFSSEQLSVKIREILDQDE